MILIRPQIMSEIKKGNIVITPFDEKKMNPNSYNLTLSDEIAWYKPLKVEEKHKIRHNMEYTEVREYNKLDMKQKHELEIIKMTEDGFELQPDRIYLAKTVEHTETYCHVPMLEGRSSVGRLGLFVHATAGFGDIGFKGYWTLELSCVQPVRIYPNVEICQIFYHSISEDYSMSKGFSYKGKYQDNRGIQPSKIYEEFKVKKT